MVFGLKDKLVDAFNEVQASNMSKICSSYDEAMDTIAVRSRTYGPCYTKEVSPGKWVVYRESDDKVMKSVNYFRPDIKNLFTEEELNNI